MESGCFECGKRTRIRPQPRVHRVVASLPSLTQPFRHECTRPSTPSGHMTTASCQSDGGLVDSAANLDCLADLAVKPGDAIVLAPAVAAGSDVGGCTVSVTMDSPALAGDGAVAL